MQPWRNAPQSAFICYRRRPPSSLSNPMLPSFHASEPKQKQDLAERTAGRPCLDGTTHMCVPPRSAPLARAPASGCGRHGMASRPADRCPETGAGGGQTHGTCSTSPSSTISRYADRRHGEAMTKISRAAGAGSFSLSRTLSRFSARLSRFLFSSLGSDDPTCRSRRRRIPIWFTRFHPSIQYLRMPPPHDASAPQPSDPSCSPTRLARFPPHNVARSPAHLARPERTTGHGGGGQPGRGPHHHDSGALPVPRDACPYARTCAGAVSCRRCMERQASISPSSFLPIV
jgi:hypothetical protein